MNLTLIIRVKKITQRELACWRNDLFLQEVEIVAGPAVDDGNADIVICMVGVRGLIDFGGARGDDVGGVEVGIEGVGLAGIDHEEHLIVPARNQNFPMSDDKQSLL